MADKLDKLMDTIDYADIARRLVSAIIEGMAVVFVSLYLVKRKGIPNTRKDIQDSLMLGLIAASVFAILDLLVAPIADGARKGAGFAIGSGIAGGL